MGGADKHSVLLARALRAKGHEVAFLATNFGPLEWDDGVFVSCTVVGETRDSLDLRKGGAVARKAFWNHEAAAAMHHLVRTFRPDVVHVHKLYPQLSVAPLATASRLGVPVVQTAHDYEGISASPYDSSGDWRDRHDSKASYRLLNTATFPVRRHARRHFVDAWISVSGFLARAYERHGITSTVLPNFIDASDIPPPAAFESRSGFAYVGSLIADKGVQDVVELARRVPDIDVTIAGDGPLRDAVEDASRQLPNLTWLGRRSAQEVRDLMSNARVMIIPSHCDDAGPLVAVEAMAAGTPIVAYGRGGLTEYVGAGGLLARDVRELAEQARHLHEAPVDWSEKSQAGWHAASSRHSIPGYLSDLERVYEAVQKR